MVTKTLPLKFTQQDARTAIGTLEATNFDLSEDFTAQWKLNAASADVLTVSTYRNPHAAMLPLPKKPQPPSTQPEPALYWRRY